MDTRFMRQPPPPPMSDPQQPPRPPPPQPAASWYPNQFNYQPLQPPPPLHNSTWPAPTNSDHQQPIQPSSSSSYPPPHHPSYPPQPQQHHNPYLPPPQHHMPLPPPPSHQYSYSQPNPNQAWGNTNWAHHQSWEHPDGINPNNHEEDWAAKARAWAAANVAMENQHQQSQFAHVARPEEPSHGYHDQYQRAVDPHYTDAQHQPLPASSHQQFSVSLGNPQRLPANHQQESLSFSSGPSSYEHVPYLTRDAALAADPSPTFPYHGINEPNLSGCQQEVPSSYSSIPGKEEVGNPDLHFHSQSPLPVSSAHDGQYHFQSRLSSSGRSVSSEQRNFPYGERPADTMSDPSDRPLEFNPGFYGEYDSHNQHTQGSYTNPDPAEPVGSADAGMPSVSTLAPPVLPGMFDPSFGTPLPGHSVPMFGQIPGPNFHPPNPTASVPFGLSMGTMLHPATAFPVDTNGISNVSERPKKASVPNWLREEIIKKKPVITSSSNNIHEEDPDNATEDNNVDKYATGSYAGGKNADSSRSSDDEDEDEDDKEATRMTAVNLEIKRVLTDVLLKVTGELFDEIASKVLSEDDLVVEVDHKIASANHNLSPSPSAPLTPKASAKILIPLKTETDDASGKSGSGLPGDVLGLASYASDDDDETESSSRPATSKMHADALPQSKFSEDVVEAAENGNLQARVRGPSRANSDNSQNKTTSTDALHNPTLSYKGSGDSRSNEDLNQENSSLPNTNKGIGVREYKINADGGKVVEAKDTFTSKDVGGKPPLKPEVQQNVASKKAISDAPQPRQHGSVSEKKDERDTRRRSADKDNVKQAEACKLRADDKHHGSSEPRRDERHARKEKADDRNGLNDKVKDRTSKHGEKARESDSRRSSSSKDDKVDSEQVTRGNHRDDSSRKRERERDEREDRSKHRTSRDSSKNKRHRSRSLDNRVKISKDESVSNRVNDSSDEASEDSKQRRLYSRKRSSSRSPTRKLHSRKRSLSPSPTRKPHSRKRSSSPSPTRKVHSKKHSLSPSPTRSRRRQVSRSPHSKHSQRRRSPYSSLDSARKRRSKSKSPVRQRR